MSTLQHSSGDLVADRRASHAAAYAADRAFAEAAELMAQALELAPRWAAGWNLLGGYREAAGDIAGAIAAWTQLAVLDERGVFGAGLKLAAHGAGTSTGPARDYVEALFDDYAQRFETSLVDRLGYRTPGELGAMIRAAMAGRGISNFARGLDLGCGTGLMGVELRPLIGRLEGVDLSARMLSEARRKGLYDRLEQAELVEFLGGSSEAAVDLVVAADVLNYVGALEPVLTGVARVLAPGGLFGFSLETHDGAAAVQLGTSLRYRHAPDAAMAACRAASFEIVATQPTIIRNDRGAPVDGLLVLVAKPPRLTPA